MSAAPVSVLQSLLRLDGSSSFTVEPGSGSGQAYVLVRCPGGLSIIAREVEALDGLATAVMDARASLLTLSGMGYRCGSEPDAVQRRYTALGVGWHDRDDRDDQGTDEWEEPVPADVGAESEASIPAWSVSKPSVGRCAAPVSDVPEVWCPPGAADRLGAAVWSVTADGVEFLTTEQTASVLEVPNRLLSLWVKRHEGPRRQWVSSRWVYTRADLTAWLSLTAA